MILRYIKRIIYLGAILTILFVNKFSYAKDINLYEKIHYNEDGSVAENVVIYVDGELYGTNNEGKIASNSVVSQNKFRTFNKYLTDNHGKIILTPGLYMIDDDTGYIIENDGTIARDYIVSTDGKRYALDDKNKEKKYEKSLHMINNNETIDFDKEYDIVYSTWKIDGKTYLIGRNAHIVKKSGKVLRERYVKDKFYHILYGKGDSDEYYFLNDDYSIVNYDFIFDGDKVYYANEYGKLLRNEMLGEYYYFNNECELVKGEVNKNNVEQIKKRLFFLNMYDLKYIWPITIMVDNIKILSLFTIKDYIENEGIRITNSKYNALKELFAPDSSANFVSTNGQKMKEVFFNINPYHNSGYNDDEIYYFDEYGNIKRNYLLKCGNDKFIFDKNGKMLYNCLFESTAYQMVYEDKANFDIEKHIGNYIDSKGALIEEKVYVEQYYSYSDEGHPEFNYFTINE